MAEKPQKPTKQPTNDFGLTDLQWRFVNEFVVDFNGTKAAKRAGIQKSCDVRACQFLRLRKVRDAIQSLLEERNTRWENTHSRVIQEAMALAYSNMLDYAEWSNQGVKLTPSDKLSRAAGASIMSIEQVDTEQGRRIKIKREPKSKAVELLMRNLGILDPVGGEDNNRGVFAKWAEEQRAMANEETEREQLRREIAELKEQLGKLQAERGERNGDSKDGEGDPA